MFSKINTMLIQFINRIETECLNIIFSIY
ncbi:hypothetical protein Gotur_027198 [Gossypium turneri]